jgi:parallel beta-helix repeat protein
MRDVTFVRLVAALGVIGLTACGGDDDPPCEGPNGPCIEIAPGADVQQRAQTALIEAQPGDVILFLPGTHEFQRGLSLAVAGVTLRGRGMDRTILSFRGQIDGAQGLLVTGDDFVIEDLAIEDTLGDALKIEGTRGVTIRRVRAEWTGGPLASNGAYGLYPVQTHDVLIEDSVAIGASDAGIYVGQSSNIIVRRNRAELNVAGIEIENSFDADVYDNVATNNTGGVLVFNLPGLQVQNGARTRVFDNQIYDNNTPNFAPPGNIVGKVPPGTGFASIAAHQTEIFNNSFRDNDTVNLGIISYLLTDIEYDDPEYDPYSDTIYIYDNEFSGGGTQPGGELGFLLVQALVTIMDAPVRVPDIVFDGNIHPDRRAAGGGFLPPYNICIQGNGAADFADLDDPNNFASVSTDMSPHDCTHPKLPAVILPGAGG